MGLENMKVLVCAVCVRCTCIGDVCDVQCLQLFGIPRAVLLADEHHTAWSMWVRNHHDRIYIRYTFTCVYILYRDIYIVGFSFCRSASRSSRRMKACPLVRSCIVLFYFVLWVYGVLCCAVLCVLTGVPFAFTRLSGESCRHFLRPVRKRSLPRRRGWFGCQRCQCFARVARFLRRPRSSYSWVRQQSWRSWQGARSYDGTERRVPSWNETGFLAGNWQVETNRNRTNEWMNRVSWVLSTLK